MKVVSAVFLLLQRFFINKRNIAGISMLVMFSFYPFVLYALGMLDEKPVPKEQIDPNLSLIQDPFFSKFLLDEEEVKPPLAYLKDKVSAEKALEAGDYYFALDKFLQMQQVYGELTGVMPEILFGIAETYFMMGNFTNAISYYKSVVQEENDPNATLKQQTFSENTAATKKQLASQNSPSTRKPTILAIERVKAYYRLAYIAYHEGNIEEFEDRLIKIVQSTQNLDIALQNIVEEQSLDYTIRLFQYPIDYSYVARRELGLHYIFNKDSVIETRINATMQEKKRESDAGAREQSLTGDAKPNNKEMGVYSYDLYNDVAEYLFSVISMAVYSLTRYIQETDEDYVFTDLQYMVERLNATKKGRELIKSFDLPRIILGIRKYYEDLYFINNQYSFMVLYCDELLKTLSYRIENPSNYIYDAHLQ